MSDTSVTLSLFALGTGIGTIMAVVVLWLLFGGVDPAKHFALWVGMVAGAWGFSRMTRA